MIKILLSIAFISWVSIIYSILRDFGKEDFRGCG